ncbi:MAG: hypothetical protein JWO38_6269 [Gemmataceae bacterium]|nr:hypothetical protein [Gemmataceae bacterium]
MTYAVTWSIAALGQLNQIATAHADPPSVDRAAVWVDSILRRYPFDMGESRSGNERLWYSDVLGVYYHVDDRALSVRIMSVGPARRH